MEGKTDGATGPKGDRRGPSSRRKFKERRKNFYERRFNTGWTRILKISVWDLIKPGRKVTFP